MNRSELKSQAKSQVKNKLGVLILITLIIGAVSALGGFVLGLVPGGSVIAAVIISPAFALSIARVYLMVTRSISPNAKDAFCGFDDFFSAFKVTFLTGLYTFLWSLLFIIPGIIKGYSYSMSMYILAENKGKSARECIKESVEMTEGHKKELFVLDLSFIGWFLLGSLTCGVAYLWVIPYYSVTRANAYRVLKSFAYSPFGEVAFEDLSKATTEDGVVEEEKDVSAQTAENDATDMSFEE